MRSTANTTRVLSRYGTWILVAAAVLLVVAVRVRLREMPLERDEGEYAYAGQLILKGVPPYKAAYNMKLPGTYCAYALTMAFLGQTPAGIHLGLILVNVASIILVFLLGRMLLDQIAGVVAAIVFALLSLSPSALGLAAHATHFVAFFALAGTLFLVHAVSRVHFPPSALNPRPSTLNSQLRNPQLFLSGLLFGVAFVMDQHGVFFGLFGGAYLLWTKVQGEGRREKGEGRRRRYATEESSGFPRLSGSAFQLLPFALGCLLPYALTCLVLWMAGIFPRFFFWTIAYASKYASANPAAMAPEMLREALRLVVGTDTLLWLLPWAGALVMWWEERFDQGREQGERRKEKTDGRGLSAPDAPRSMLHALHSSPPSPLPSSFPSPRLFLTALLLCSIAAVSVGYYFRAHYFILLLPAFALLSGVAVSRGWRTLKQDRSIELFLAVPMLGLFLIGTGATLIGNGEMWFRMAPAAVVRESYGTTLFSEAINVGNYLKSHAAKEARVLVLGSEPEIYFYSRRRSVTGYIYTYPLMEPQPYALKMQEEVISEIENGRPEYVVLVKDDLSWLRRPESEHKLDDWWESYWASRLDLVQTIELQGRKEPPESERETGTQPERKYLLVLKRRD